MTVRHTLLAVGAVIVAGMAIYLVREVGRTPSDAQARTERATPTPTPPPPAKDTKSDPPTKATLPAQETKQIASADTPPVEDRPRPAIAEIQPPEVAQILPPAGANPKMDLVMAEANRAYDQGDFEDAKQIATKVLAKAPGNVRMLRIVVSSECIAGDSAEAQKYFTQLPEADRAQMRTRCERYGVTLKDP